MPNRLLKEGICTSETINQLNALAETFFYRLLVVSDDYGRMDARPAILKSCCFPLKDSILPSDVRTLLSMLQDSKLIELYEVDDKPLLQINKWEQRVRSKGKYPPPVSNPLSNDSSLRSDDGLGLGRGLGKGKGLGEGRGNGEGNPTSTALAENVRKPKSHDLAKSLAAKFTQKRVP